MRGITCCGMVLGLMLALMAPQAAARGKHSDKRKDRQDKPKGVVVVKEGKIRVVRGMRAEPELTDQQGKKHLCIGPLRDELLRLHGHTVRASGTVEGKKLLAPTFRVGHYEILDAGGRKPLVGTLRRQGKERLMLERTEGNVDIKARAAFRRRLRRRVGCKIWIVGDLEGTTLKASKYGWIRCKIPKVIKPRKETTK